MRGNIMRRTLAATVLPSFATAAALVFVGASNATAVETPRLGFQGTVVDLKPDVGVPAPDGVPNRGIRVDSVRPNTPAARMGLERGDIVIAIDVMRFTTLEGYYQALRCSGQRPSIVLINVRNGRLTRKSISLPHEMPSDDECGARPPDSYLMSIDLESDFRR
jgi:S1-C subfamily serine protease